MTELLQFIPEDFLYLDDSKKIFYKGLYLKTDYIVNIINDFIVRRMFEYSNFSGSTNSNEVDLYSIILKTKYGKHYNYYIDYLVEKKYLILTSNYYSGFKCKTYVVNDLFIDSKLKRIKICDKILLTKLNKIAKDFNNNVNIVPQVRDKIITDLSNIKIDYLKAYDYIVESDMDRCKKMKNILSIESIKSNHLFYKFDEYGRFHTNFTILRKELRNNYVFINNEFIYEIDIKNSQPLFLSALIKKTCGVDNIDYKDFYDVVENGLIYEQFQNILKGWSRKDIKKLIYKVLFGDNRSDKEEDSIFRLLYPKVYNFIIDYKINNGGYKSLSHKLQQMESNFIYNHVVLEIYEKYPEISLFTVHDSINVPYSYKSKVEIVFNKNFKKLLANNLEI